MQKAKGQKRLRSTVTFVFGATSGLSLLSGCDFFQKDAPVDPAPETERPLLEPEERARGPARCVPVKDARPLTLRSKSTAGADGSAVEVGTAAAVLDGFAVGVLQVGPQMIAQVAFTNGKGKEQLVDLGRVHGSVDPPKVLALADGSVVVAVSDNDASNWRIRLARVSSLSQKPEVLWGPEVQVQRGDTSEFALGMPAADKAADEKAAPHAALLVWDDYDKASAESRIVGLSFSTLTMKALGPERVLSSGGDDATSPTLAARRGGLFLTWLAFLDLPPQRAEADTILVDEPPRILRVAKIDDRGPLTGEPISITDPAEQVVAYDVAGSTGDSLRVAYRAFQTAGQADIAPIYLADVKADGSVTKSSVIVSDLGPGAPLWLTSVETTESWLYASGRDDDAFLGIPTEPGRSISLTEESGLVGQLPLARSGPTLLTLAPDGLDLRLSVVTCTGLAKP